MRDETWIFTEDRKPPKKSGQILVDLYPLSGVHSYEVLEYIEMFDAFCSVSSENAEPVDMNSILCWKPILPPYPRKKSE